jgi:hypothetical protein
MDGAAQEGALASTFALGLCGRVLPLTEETARPVAQPLLPAPAQELDRIVFDTQRRIERENEVVYFQPLPQEPPPPPEGKRIAAALEYALPAAAPVVRDTAPAAFHDLPSAPPPSGLGGGASAGGGGEQSAAGCGCCGGAPAAKPVASEKRAAAAGGAADGPVQAPKQQAMSV